jgi:hypothetical protein
MSFPLRARQAASVACAVSRRVALSDFAATLPQGEHESRHRREHIAFLRWAASRAEPFTFPPLRWREDAAWACRGCVLNRYVAPADGQPLRDAWESGQKLAITDAGRAVLARADAAERGAVA